MIVTSGNPRSEARAWRPFAPVKALRKGAAVCFSRRAQAGLAGCDIHSRSSPFLHDDAAKQQDPDEIMEDVAFGFEHDVYASSEARQPTHT